MFGEGSLAYDTEPDKSKKSIRQITWTWKRLWSDVSVY
jgi:hypothetical protein